MINKDQLLATLVLNVESAPNLALLVDLLPTAEWRYTSFEEHPIISWYTDILARYVRGAIQELDEPVEHWFYR